MQAGVGMPSTPSTQPDAANGGAIPAAAQGNGGAMGMGQQHQQQQLPQIGPGVGKPPQQTMPMAGNGQDFAAAGPGVQSSAKSAYARKLKNGEKPSGAPPPGVQSSVAPVEATGDYEHVNGGLEGDAPRMVSFYRDNSRFYASLDRSSFVDDAFRGGGRNGFWGGRGSMMGMSGGSLYGMGGGSMYGMGGGGPMGSMYGGGNPMMGSMYGRGPMGGMGGMGSMYMPGSMYASGYTSRPASLFGSMYGMGSMYGGQQPDSMMMNPGMGGMGGMGSMGGMDGMGSMGGAAGPSNYGMGSMYNSGMMMGAADPTAPNSMYGGGPGMQSAYQQPNSFYDQQQQPPFGEAPGAPAGPAGEGPGAAGQRGLPGAEAKPTPGTNARATPGDSRSAPIPTHVLLIDAPPAPGMQVVLRKDPSVDKCLLLGEQSRQVFVDELSVGANAPQIITAWKQGPQLRAMIEHAAAGHNVAVVVANDDAMASQAASLQVVEAVLLEAIARVDTAVKKDAPTGYADAQFFCCSFKSATEAKDLIEGAAAPYKKAEIGSHPLFGPGFMNMKSTVVSVANNGAKTVMHTLQSITPQLRAEDPVQVVQLIVKQVRMSAKTGAPDVLVSSVLAIINNAAAGGRVGSAYFAAARNEATVPPALVKAAFGGACCSLGVLSVSAAARDPSQATAALTALMDLHATNNVPPRSGSLQRFVNFAKGEAERLSGKPDANPAVTQKVTSMLKDGEELLANPRKVQPKPYPISHSTNRTNTPSTAMAHGNGVGRTPASGVAPGAGERGGTAAAGGAHSEDEKADSNNPIRSTLIVGQVEGVAQTLQMEPDGFTVTDTATGAQATVTEIVTRDAEDWRTTESAQANELQAMFQNGNNTAIVGTVSPTERNTLDKQPLWLSYKRMVSSLLSVASQKYSFAEVSLSMALLDGKDLVADLFSNLDADPANATQIIPKKLSVSFSPLSGPAVHKATIIKPPTPLQLEGTINSALYQVPTILESRPSGRSIIFASAVLKGVTDDDVYTCSLVGASTTDPTVLLDIVERKDTAPHELFEYAFGGPCCTLFLGDVNQGDNNVAAVMQVLNAISAKRNRTVRVCSVKRFVAFAEGTLRKFDEKLANAKTEKEKEMIAKGKKSMEVFHNEYKALLNDPEHVDPKNYRRGGRNDDGTSVGSRASGASKREKRSADGTSVERKRRAAAGDGDTASCGSRGSRGRPTLRDGDAAAKRTPSTDAKKSSGAGRDAMTGGGSRDPKKKAPASSSATGGSKMKRTNSASKKK